MSTQQEKILRIFLDKELTKECVETKLGESIMKLHDILIPGQERKAQLWVRFDPFKESHVYEISSITATGDARVLGYGSGHRVVRAGESFPIDLLWTGRFMSLRDLEDLAAKVEINGIVRSR